MRALAERADVKKSPREVNLRGADLRVALIDADPALIIYDADPPTNANADTFRATNDPQAQDQSRDHKGAVPNDSQEPARDSSRLPPYQGGIEGGSSRTPTPANEPQAPARGSSDSPVPPSPAFLAYWQDYQTGELFVFGRRLYDRHDIGHALRNLTRDLAADSRGLLQLDPDLERALAIADLEPEDATTWHSIDDGTLADLMPLAQGVVADAPVGPDPGDGDLFDPDPLFGPSAVCGPGTSGTGPRRIIPPKPKDRVDSDGLYRAVLNLVGCGGGGCGWCDRGGWLLLSEVCPACTKCCNYPPGCCDSSLCDPVTGWCPQTCCRSNKFCIPLTSSCCDYTACSSDQHCCYAPDHNHTRCCPTGYSCYGTNPVNCCAPGDICCNGQCGTPGCCKLPEGNSCMMTHAGCCLNIPGAQFLSPEYDCCATGQCCALTEPVCCDDGHCCRTGQTCCGPTTCCDVGEQCCGHWCIDPSTQGCCGGQPYNLETQKCCDEGGGQTAAVTAGGGNPEVCAIDASCCANACCADGLMCCNDIECCAPQRCCGGLVCCPELPCEACVDYGELSHGSLTVSPPVACVGETITFSLADAGDTGGERIVPCSAHVPIAAAPHCAWTLTVPPNYPPPLPPSNGDGCFTSVEAKVAGTYGCRFTLSADRACAPTPLEVGPETATAIKIRPKSVTFGGTAIPITRDDGTGDYPTPHWQDNSTPKDDDNDDAGDHNIPVAYVRNQTLSLDVEFDVDSPIALSGTVIVNGVGLAVGGKYLFSGNGSASGGTLSATLTADTSLPDAIGYYHPLYISWSIDVLGPAGVTTFDCIHPTEHRVYILLGTPNAGSRYETLMDLSCNAANGLSNETAAVAAIWNEFTDRKVRRKPQDGFNISDGTQLTYWSPTNPAPEPLCWTTAGLLKIGDGRCGAWANFLNDTFGTQGIVSGVVTTVDAPSLLDVPAWNAAVQQAATAGLFPPNANSAELGAPIFYVKSWNLTSGSPFAPTDLPGVEGQGNSDPRAFFDNHAIVKYASKYYDPSYGTGPSNTAISWEDSSLDGFGAYTILKAANGSTVGVMLYRERVDPKGTLECTFTP